MPPQPAKPASLLPRLPRWWPRRFDWRARRLIARIRGNHGDLGAIEALASHYTRRSDHGSLANLMEGFGETLRDAHAAADAYVRAADAALLLNDRARAETLYERALARQPGHSEALDRALRVAEAGQDVSAMRRVLESVIETRRQLGVPGAQLAHLHYRLGQLYETRLNELKQAARYYRTAIDENPLLAGAIRAARRLAERDGDHAAVGTLFELEMDATRAADDKRALLLGLAQYQRDQIHDVDAEILSLRRACKLASSDLTALRRLALALIERAERAISERARRTDQKRAAEVCYQLGRGVPRAEAEPWLVRALELAPKHARAAALLLELRGHGTAQASECDALQREPQRVVDQRATLQLSAASAAAIRAPRSYPPARDLPPLAAGLANAPAAGSEHPGLPADATLALSTSELLPLRIVPEPPGQALQPTAAGDTQALSTSELRLLRITPPPPPAAALTPARETPAADAAGPAEDGATPTRR